MHNWEQWRNHSTYFQKGSSWVNVGAATVQKISLAGYSATESGCTHLPYTEPHNMFTTGIKKPFNGSLMFHISVADDINATGASQELWQGNISFRLQCPRWGSAATQAGGLSSWTEWANRVYWRIEIIFAKIFDFVLDECLRQKVYKNLSCREKKAAE